MAVLSPATRGRPRRRWGAALVLLGLVGRGPVAAQPAVPEYRVKAVFLYNFAQFVGWPAQAFPADQKDFVIGILGEDPFGSYLDDAVRGESVDHHPMVVRRYRRMEDIKNCHVLFVSRSAMDRWDEIQAGLKGRCILTVGDAAGFAERGGMIRLVNEDNRIRFRINLAAVRAAELTISSNLLRLAEVLRPRKE